MMLVCFAAAVRCWLTCIASSRVGERMSALRRRVSRLARSPSARIPLSTGRPNASVLPDPVSAEPTTSLQSRPAITREVVV